MKNDRKFSEVATAYNTSLACLDEARQVFEKEVVQINSVVLDHLYAASKRMNQEDKSSKKLRWQEPVDDSRDREGAWLNYAARSVLGLDIKAPGSKVFRKNSAYLYFEIVFDRDGEKQFVFQCRFENQNLVNEALDEKVLEVVNAKPDIFSSRVHFKANTTILFRHKLDDSLFDRLNQYIDSAMLACQEAICAVYPDSAYKVVVEDERLAG